MAIENKSTELNPVLTNLERAKEIYPDLSKYRLFGQLFDDLVEVLSKRITPLDSLTQATERFIEEFGMGVEYSFLLDEFVPCEKGRDDYLTFLGDITMTCAEGKKKTKAAQIFLDAYAHKDDPAKLAELKSLFLNEVKARVGRNITKRYKAGVLALKATDNMTSDWTFITQHLKVLSGKELLALTASRNLSRAHLAVVHSVDQHETAIDELNKANFDEHERNYLYRSFMNKNIDALMTAAHSKWRDEILGITLTRGNRNFNFSLWTMLHLDEFKGMPVRNVKGYGYDSEMQNSPERIVELIRENLNAETLDQIMNVQSFLSRIGDGGNHINTPHSDFFEAMLKKLDIEF